MFNIGNLRNLFEDLILTSPYLGTKPKLRMQDSSLNKNLLHLKKYGYCKLNNLLKNEDLYAIKNEINYSIKNSHNISQNLKHNSISFKKPLLVHSALTSIAINPSVLDLVESYFNRISFVSDIDLRRIFPADNDELLSLIGYSNCSWHRDTRGRQLKLMIYLSDVGPDDSNFSFVPKTHNYSFLRKRYSKSRFSDELINKMKKKPIEWLGKEGDAYLFDTNIIHRLRRKKSANIRDSFTVYYTPGQELRYLDLNSKLKKINNNPALQEPKCFYFRPRIKY